MDAARTDAAAADGRSNLATVTIRVTAVTITAPSVTFGDDGSVSVGVSAPAGPPGDEVALVVDDDQPRTTAPEPSGLARFTLTGLNAGAHRLSARYTNSDYQGAATATATLGVDKATPVISWPPRWMTKVHDRAAGCRAAVRSATVLTFTPLTWRMKSPG